MAMARRWEGTNRAGGWRRLKKAQSTAPLPLPLSLRERGMLCPSPSGRGVGVRDSPLPFQAIQLDLAIQCRPLDIENDSCLGLVPVSVFQSSQDVVLFHLLQGSCLVD